LRSDHLALTASADFVSICRVAELCLTNEGLPFIQNKTKDLVEFEVERPAYFRIVIQTRKDPEVGNIFMPSLKAARGSFIDIWFSPDQDEIHNREAAGFAKQFLRSLASSLPQQPWEGLKFRESGRARKKWKEALD